MRSPVPAVVGPLSASLIAFVRDELALGSQSLLPETALFHDLGVDGADGWEFMEAFARRFQVNIDAFEPALHFGPEAAWNPMAALWWLFRPSRKPQLIPVRLAMLQAAIDAGTWGRVHAG